MKHLQSGFSVIEMLISMAISAMLMTASLSIYNQISKGAFTIQRITQTDTQIMILHNRLAADLQGLCPLWFTTEMYEKLKKSEKGDSKQSSMPEPSGGSSSKKRNNFLYAQSNGKQFDFLTFVSTNALQVFGDKQLRTVRVIYMLQPEGQNLKTFKLMRKEDDTISGDLDLDKLKTGIFYQIAHKITECSIEYGFIEIKGKKADTAQSSDKPFEFKFVSQWGGVTQSEKEEDKTPTLPDILKLTLKIQHTPNQEPKSYELFCTIPTCHAPSIKSFAQLRQEESKKNQPEAKSTEKKEGGDQTKNKDEKENANQPKDKEKASAELPFGVML
ncbi:hypothetical protein A3J41_01825 [candidate division TM6 bacterium RIFCSPHIGHO2_12_FULL_38_8]|nr:MAG: hypothetical protein A3J41_01825 [candidate division TM6 bacterium RIFCSPHIGHO2_12_FULL_38_8]